MSETGKAFENLVDIVAKLRGPDGCPWDREQTHDTLKQCVIEETYEVVDALDAHDMSELRGELGDLLLQVIFHAELASETKTFDIKDVVDGISEKLVRRHPHVFGEVSVKDSDEVLVNWEQIKSKEKGFEKRKSALDGVPNTLPALSRAMKISKRAAKVGFEWPTMEAVFEKLHEEIGELKQEVESGTPERISEEVGDLLFTVVNIARWAKVDPEDSLRQMTKRFSRRFRKIEEAARAQGRYIEDMSLQEMDEVWNKAKKDI